MDAARSEHTAWPTPTTILHVIECWGGGVSTAVMSYIRATPHLAHWLITAPRRGEVVKAEPMAALRGRLALPAGHLARINAIGRAYARLKPDVVHAHSSFAGLYVRTCRSIPASRIVYTPHCYAFERADVPKALRTVFRTTEAVLARRTGTVAAVSPREASLATALHRAQRVVYVPNAASSSLAPFRVRVTDRPMRAVTVGRICAQKDPHFLARATRIRDDSISWAWIGDGDARLRHVLESAGVHVTGWLPHGEVIEQLRAADVYIHSALWESAPMSLLEAVAAGLPVVARDIPALRVLGIPNLARTPTDLATAVAELADPASWQKAASQIRAALRDNTVENLADRLTYAYAGLSGESTERRAQWLTTSGSR